MAEAEPNGAAENRKRRKFPTVLVALPDWPPQDPGRKMIYWVRPTMHKAEKMAKRLRRQLPEFIWSTAELTAAESTALERAPFTVKGAGLATPMQVRWTGRSWKVEAVKQTES